MFCATFIGFLNWKLQFKFGITFAQTYAMTAYFCRIFVALFGLAVTTGMVHNTIVNHTVLYMLLVYIKSSSIMNANTNISCICSSVGPIFSYGPVIGIAGLERFAFVYNSESYISHNGKTMSMYVLHLRKCCMSVSLMCDIFSLYFYAVSLSMDSASCYGVLCRC